MDGVAVQVKALPEVWPLPQLTLFARGWAPDETVTVCVNAVEFTPVLSWTIKVTSSLHGGLVQLA